MIGRVRKLTEKVKDAVSGRVRAGGTLQLGHTVVVPMVGNSREPSSGSGSGAGD